MRFFVVLAPLMAAALTSSTPGAVLPVLLAVQAPVRVSTAMPERLFISGHSLTDQPFGDYLALLARAEGRNFHWDMQSLAGSSLQDRTHGVNGPAGSGYRQGTDANGEPADVLRAFSAEDSAAPDALLLAEQHTLLESLIWKDMMGSASDYIRQFRAVVPGGPIYIFASWLNIDNPDDPSRWLAYERAAAVAWRCAAARIGQVSETDVTLIPAADALATLVEEALAGRVAGVSASRPRDTTRALFADDVHLTPAATYYTALVTYGLMGGSLGENHSPPPEIAPEAGASLRRVAHDYVARGIAAKRMDEQGCKAYFGERFVPAYLDYVRDARWLQEGLVQAYYKWARFRLTWPKLLQSDSSDNPLVGGAGSAHAMGGENSPPVLPNAVGAGGE